MERMKNKAVQVLLILGLVLLVRIPDLPYHYMDWDEAAMMSQAWALTQGQVLYRDIWQIHPVLNFAIFWPFFSLLDPDLAPHMIKLLNLILIALGALLVRRICARWLADDSCGLLAALLFVFYFAFRWAQSSYGEFYAVFPVLLSAEWLLFSPGAAWRNCFLAGASGAVAMLFKQVAVFDLLGLYLAFLFFHHSGLRGKVTSSLLLIAGIAAVFLPVGALLMSKGILHESVESMVVRPLTAYTGLIPTHGSLVGDVLVQRLILFSRNLARAALPFCVPLVLGIAGLIGALSVMGGPAAWPRSLSPGAWSATARGAAFGALLLWLLLDLMGIACIGRFVPHYLIQLIPAMALLSAYAPGFLSKKLRAVLLCAVIVSVYAAGCTVFVQRIAKTGWTPDRVRRSRGIADYLRANTSGKDRIFLYRVDNLDVFYLAGRLSNNGIYMFIDMFEEHSHDAKSAAERREAFLRDLPKALLVDPQGPLLGCESSPRFFSQVIGAHYSLRAVVEDVEIYFLRETPRETEGPSADSPGSAGSGWIGRASVHRIHARPLPLSY
jgi:hypothetical protein